MTLPPDVGSAPAGGHEKGDTDPGSARREMDSLRERLARKQLALEGAGIGDWELDLRTRQSHHRSSLHDRIFGYDTAPAAWSYDRFMEHVHADDRAEVGRRMREALATGEPWDLECRIIRTDGVQRWIWVRGGIHYDDDRRPSRAAGVVRDITDRKCSEERLRASEARYRALVHATASAVWTADTEGDIRISAIDEDLLSEDRQPEPWIDLIHPDDREQALKAWQRAIETGDVYEVEHRSRDGDGEYRHFLSRAVPVRGDDGKVTEWVGTSADVTERARAEEALRASETQFRTLANSIPQLAWMADEQGSIFWYNQRWYDYTGTTLEEMEGWGWQKVHHPDEVDRVVEEIRRAFETGEPWEDTFPLRSATGEYRWFLSRALPIRDEEGRIVRWFGTNTDIQEQREAELERDRALREAEEANQAKSEFLATMSHELRTPLNAIAGYVELLEMGIHGPLTDDQADALGRIRQSEHRLLTVINDILNFAKLEAGNLDVRREEIRLAPLLGQMEALIRPQVDRKQIAYRFDGCDPRVTALGDADRVQQILLNLLGNAVKFTDGGGRVGVSCDLEEPWAHIHVRDTGPGIPPDRLEAIFDPFVQLEPALTRRADGTGLGLAISRDLARLMGGDLTVDSTVGEGSVFTLTLPRPAD
jgi:PAS domain S-box-containing protein